MQMTMTPTSSSAATRDCGCGSAGSISGLQGCDEPVGLERTRYFARQLVGPDDLTQDQCYFREKHRRHNRLLHGWGIVCGACVTPARDAGKVQVTQGYVLGPYGDEIVIDRDVTVDLLSQDPAGAAFDPCAAVDPWCTDVRVERGQRPWWLCVRYAQCETRPVAVSACGCGCQESECEYTRIRDSFELRVLDTNPEQLMVTLDEPSLRAEKSLANDIGAGIGLSVAGLAGAFSCTGRTGRRICPPCPASPWVVLAQVTVTSGGDVKIVSDPWRRYVASFGAFSFRCRGSTDTTGDAGQRTLEQAVAYIDPARDVETPPPAATVAARTGDGRWLVVPGTFTVAPGGEKLGALVARVGAQTLIDPQTGDPVRLDELYAAAGADPDIEVTSVADALAPLEGARLDVSGLRVVRGQLDALIDQSGVDQLQTDAAGSPAAATSLPAASLTEAGDASSAVSKAIKGQSVDAVAAQTRDAFAAGVAGGLKGERRAAAIAQAQSVWDAASRVARLAAAWSASRQ